MLSTMILSFLVAASPLDPPCSPDNPECFHEFPLCKPIVPGHNNRFENRVNWVFVGYQFPNLDSLRQTVRGAVDMDNPFIYWSLMKAEPFKSNKDKINLWYVDKSGPYADMESVIQVSYPEVKEDSILRQCPQFKNQYVVIYQYTWDVWHMLLTVLNSYYFGTHRTTAGVAYPGTGYIWMFSHFPFAFNQQEAARMYLVHEWGHIFGNLPDEYINTKRDRTDNSSQDPAVRCQSFCSGQPKTYEELRNIQCRNFDYFSCQSQKLKGNPCYWHGLQCVNVVDYCASYASSDSCLEVPFCAWIGDAGPDKWHKNSCFPYNTGQLNPEQQTNIFRQWIYETVSYPVLNVGTQCQENKGCYSCSSRNVGGFRADQLTIMRQDYVNSYGHHEQAQIQNIIDRYTNPELDINEGFWEFQAVWERIRELQAQGSNTAAEKTPSAAPVDKQIGDTFFGEFLK